MLLDSTFTIFLLLTLFAIVIRGIDVPQELTLKGMAAPYVFLEFEK